MSKFSEQVNKFISCEVSVHGKVSFFAKLDDGSWVAVLGNGSLDNIEMTSDDFCSMLESLESIGANIRFTNHSAI